MSVMRLSGLASGMDTDLMVQTMMKAESLKVTRYEQSKQVSLWKQEAYTNMNKMFANFILNTRKDMGLTKTTSTGLSIKTDYSNLSYVKKATSSDETKAVATSTGKAVNGSFSFEIKKLAEGATFTSGSLDEIKFEDEASFKINGKEIKVGGDSGIKSMDDLVKAINNYKYKDGEKEVSLGVTAHYNKYMEEIKDGEGKVIGHKQVGSLSLQTQKTGTDSKIEIDTISDTSGNLSKIFGTGVSEIGSNAEVKFNGTDMQFNSNNIELNGVGIELKETGTVNINVSTNTEGIMDKIEKLIDDYNELVEKTSKLLGEKKYSSYKPLSEDERKEMKESDLKLWDEKAKSGLLNSDDTISRVLQNARNELYRTIEGAGFKNITELGITTEKYARGTVGGKLEIDKDKLRAAIEKDPEGVMKVLFNEDDTQPADSKNSTQGVFTRVYDTIIEGMKSIVDKSGPGDDRDLLRSVRSNILIDFVTKKSSISDLDREVLDANKRIDDLNAMLYRKENAYYQKFANMEKMLAQMQNQSSWIGQQLMR